MKMMIDGDGDDVTADDDDADVMLKIMIRY